MAKIALDGMSYIELRDLHDQIRVAIDDRKRSERLELRKRIEALAQDSGFDVDEIVGASRGSRKGIKVAPKYRNPKNPEETWTGRGRQPRWLAAEIGKGRKIESFLIK